MAVKKLPNESEIDTTLVRQLADILKETELSEIEVERGENGPGDVTVLQRLVILR